MVCFITYLIHQAHDIVVNIHKLLRRLNISNLIVFKILHCLLSNLIILPVLTQGFVIGNCLCQGCRDVIPSGGTALVNAFCIINTFLFSAAIGQLYGLRRQKLCPDTSSMHLLHEGRPDRQGIPAADQPLHSLRSIAANPGNRGIVFGESRKPGILIAVRSTCFSGIDLILCISSVG